MKKYLFSDSVTFYVNLRISVHFKVCVHFINLKRVVKWGYILQPCNTIKATVCRRRLCKKDSGHTRMNQGHGTHNARLFFEVHVIVVEQIGLFRADKDFFISGFESLLWSFFPEKTSKTSICSSQVYHGIFWLKVF